MVPLLEAQITAHGCDQTPASNVTVLLLATTSRRYLWFLAPSHCCLMFPYVCKKQKQRWPHKWDALEKHVFACKKWIVDWHAMCSHDFANMVIANQQLTSVLLHLVTPGTGHTWRHILLDLTGLELLKEKWENLVVVSAAARTQFVSAGCKAAAPSASRASALWLPVWLLFYVLTGR